MRKSILLCFGLISLSLAGAVQAQLPASPWNTAAFDAAVAASAQSDSGVGHITRSDDSRVNIPSVKYKAINADAEAPVYKPVIDSAGNAKTGVMVQKVDTLSTTTAKDATPSVASTARYNSGDAWRGSGRFGQLDYTGEVTTYGTAYGQEMLAPEVNNHNMNVMLQHLRDLGYKIPDSYDNKFQNFLQDYSRDLRQAYDGLGHQNNPFDTMFSGFIDVVEDQSGLDMDNLLFNSIDLMSQD